VTGALESDRSMEHRSAYRILEGRTWVTAAAFSRATTPLVPHYIGGGTRIEPEQEERDLLAYGNGMGFVLDGTYTVYGPNCYGNTCYPAKTECEKGGGFSIGGLFCAVSRSKSNKSFGFTTEEGLPGGIIMILSLLSFIVVVQSVVLFIWWRKRGTDKDKESIEEPTAHVDSPSDPMSSDSS
jgi:hypothetical protein